MCLANFCYWKQKNKTKACQRTNSLNKKILGKLFAQMPHTIFKLYFLPKFISLQPSPPRLKCIERPLIQNYRKMFYVMSRAWDKENILSPHQESNPVLPIPLSDALLLSHKDLKKTQLTGTKRWMYIPEFGNLNNLRAGATIEKINSRSVFLGSFPAPT